MESRRDDWLNREGFGCRRAWLSACFRVRSSRRLSAFRAVVAFARARAFASLPASSRAAVLLCASAAARAAPCLSSFLEFFARLLAWPSPRRCHPFCLLACPDFFPVGRDITVSSRVNQSSS